ncbi:SusC/RagA family TonB-linked outer membrane protein [Roseisolibacter agri]|uniref:SusC/RagA family TonB-linked outer membrane protein n=1 Tax=Roseisolibacter agri TaxID=2014610 RepID=A0AA37Q7F5_9BACT|nr:SusC/RagA family TonB-linked outer membrane protein [Roseisolibacter agri]GLC27950.1 SusC/RagA family TonB-linked outer membrane protein [Roseisolibacter agri]
MRSPFASPAGKQSGHISPVAAALLALAAAGPPAALVGLLAVPGEAAAQATQGIITGVVVAEGTQRPLPDAQVSVEGTTNGAATDANGRFRVAGLTGTEVRLTVRRIGYQPATVTARVGATDVRVTLRERALELSQVVVTGTAGVQERRAIGNAVSTVNVAEVTATQPVRNFSDLLTGRASGVSVIGSSGQVGTGSRIRVRGASSLSLANDPLIYVDGIRVDNAQASGPTNQAFGSASVSRWNDFDPDDIESIEVIKGPAAATLYGTEASNGVIQIITKKGAAGRPGWNFTVRQGSSWLPGWKDGYGYVNYGTVPRAGSTTALDTVSITIAQLNDSLNAHFGHDIFRAGRQQDYQANVSGGTAALRYYVGLNREEATGVERANRLQRTNFRANVSASPSRTVDVTASSAFVTGRTYLPYESGGGGATWATYFSSPSFLYSGRNANNAQLGFRSGPPDIYYAAYNIFQDADRFTSSLQVTNRPASWLDHRLILGIDRLVEDNQTQAPRNETLFATYAAFSEVGGTTQGSLAVGTRNVANVTADYAFNAKYTIASGLAGVTSAGGQYYGRRTRGRAMSATGFPASGILALSAAAVQRLDGDSLFDNNTLGGFVQQQLIWNDRLFVTGAVRRDDNSAFGTDYPAVTYPKVSASYVVSEEPALSIPKAFSTLRLRGAYGGSGLQPGAFDAIRTYTASGGFLTPSNVGNTELGPEKSTELELGLDGGLLDDRYGFELTYYAGTTRDAILSRQAPPSIGFPGFQLFNAGRVDRDGFEWVLRAQPIRSRLVTLDLGLNGSANKYEIKSLGPAQTVSLTSNVQHVVGYAPGAWWDRRIVSADYNATTKRATNLRCDDGKGGSTDCATAPRVFLGNTVPTKEGSFTAGLSFLENWRVNAFFDYRGGYKKLDGNLRVRCGAFALCRDLYYPDEVQDKVLLAAEQAGTAYTFHLIRDANFTRFRELSVTYTFPRALAQRFGGTNAGITVAGRNLALWTDYTGLEPEASFNGGSRGGQFGQWEQNVLPQTRSVVATLNFSF